LELGNWERERKASTTTLITITRVTNMVTCQWCNKEIEDGENAKEITGPDGSADGWLHQKCAKLYLNKNTQPPRKVA